jgi:hypothetical protein
MSDHDVNTGNFLFLNDFLKLQFPYRDLATPKSIEHRIIKMCSLAHVAIFTFIYDFVRCALFRAFTSTLPGVLTTYIMCTWTVDYEYRENI